MKIIRRLLGSLRRKTIDAEMTEEMRLHLEQRERENLEAGMSPEEARDAALRRFGGVEQVKELARGQRPFVWLEQMGQDVRFALRQLGRAKGFTAVVVLTLALGIGATTAIYSVVDRVIFHPVPGPDPEQVVQIGQWIKYANRPTANRAGLSPPTLEAIEANRGFFAEVTWCDSVQLERRGDDFSTLAFGTAVPANFFPLLGVRPLLGRVFTADESMAMEDRRPVRDSAIILSHDWWTSEFAGDPNILGRAIEMGGRRFTVVGVMPAHFRYPGGQFWLPVEPARPKPRVMWAPNIKLIARLKPGVTLGQTQAMLDTVAARLLQDYPAGDRHYGDSWRRTEKGLSLWVLPLRAAIQDSDGQRFEDLRRTLLGFLAAIGFVLAIACANVANLSLAHTERRQHELAVRAALGAGRLRLIRQLLTESVLLAGLGGAAGLVVTAWGIKLLATFNTLPQLRPIEIDGGVLAITFLASGLTGLGFGLAPALQGGRARINEALGHGGAGATTGGRAGRYRGTLVIVEVALAVVLLSGAGLMIQSVVRLLRVDPGFDPANLVSVRFRIETDGRTGAEERRNTTLARLHERLAALPGVSAVGIFKDGFWEEKVMLAGRPEPMLLNRAHCGWEGSDAFRAARIPLVAGRHFDRGDVGTKGGPVIVNETLAELCWPGENAIGKTFSQPERRDAPTYEVVGVVRDARLYQLDENARPVFYRPYPEASLTGVAETLIVRTQQDPGGIIPAIRRELKTVHPAMRLPEISAFRQALFDATRAQRTYRNYLAVFAGAGLALSALGIYGVLAYAVARRTRELGIRVALGAERRHVLSLVMGAGARLIGAGVAVGLIAAFWLTKLLQRQLFGVSAHDPMVLSAAVAVLVVVALVACWLPARRAANVNPITALRTE